MKIAIIGSGISGMTCGWLLNRKHEIKVFEAGSYIGGHTNTVDFEHEGREFSVDTGFIVCNERTYPNFLTLMDHLGITRIPTTMGFSVRCDQTGLEYCGAGFSGLFVQRSNLFRPRFLKMVRDILRFNREGSRDADRVAHDQSVGEYLDSNRYGREFAKHYLLPMGSAIWSCPVGTFRDFPVRFILEFYRHHGLLQIRNRPQWYVIEGGSQRYVDKLTAGFRDRIKLCSPVKSVRRHASGVDVNCDDAIETFDEVIFACHSDQALNILSDPDPVETELLSAFPYEASEAILHHDCSVLPSHRKAWSSWNYRLRANQQQAATLTYNMNILQHIDSQTTFNVSLNVADDIDESKIISRHRYSHPIFTLDRHAVQQRHDEMIRANRTSFCGAYWGNGFHEDGVRSALDVCRKFGATDVLDQELSDGKYAFMQPFSSN